MQRGASGCARPSRHRACPPARGREPATHSGTQEQRECTVTRLTPISIGRSVELVFVGRSKDRGIAATVADHLGRFWRRGSEGGGVETTRDERAGQHLWTSHQEKVCAGVLQLEGLAVKHRPLADPVSLPLFLRPDPRLLPHAASAACRYRCCCTPRRQPFIDSLQPVRQDGQRAKGPEHILQGKEVQVSCCRRLDEATPGSAGVGAFRKEQDDEHDPASQRSTMAQRA